MCKQTWFYHWLLFGVNVSCKKSWGVKLLSKCWCIRSSRSKIGIKVGRKRFLECQIRTTNVMYIITLRVVCFRTVLVVALEFDRYVSFRSCFKLHNLQVVPQWYYHSTWWSVMTMRETRQNLFRISNIHDDDQW